LYLIRKRFHHCYHYEIIHHPQGNGRKQRLSNFHILSHFFRCQLCNLEYYHNYSTHHKCKPFAFEMSLPISRKGLEVIYLPVPHCSNKTWEESLVEKTSNSVIIYLGINTSIFFYGTGASNSEPVRNKFWGQEAKNTAGGQFGILNI
jgi:hypothetical protein